MDLEVHDDNTTLLVLQLESLNAHEAVRRLPLVIFIGLLSLFGIVGNLHVIIIFMCKYEHRSTYTVFVTCLAFLDLIGCCLNMPFEIVDNVLPFMFYNSAICRIFRFSNTTVSVTSLFLMYVIAFERYKKVCKPLKMQISHARRNALLAFALSITVSWPSAVLNGHRTVILKNNVTGSDCSTNDQFRGTIYPVIHSGLLFITFIISSVTLTIFYIVIGRAIQKSRIQRSAMMKVTKILFLITALLILTYLPHLILVTIVSCSKGFDEKLGPVGSVIYRIAVRLYYVNNVVNPIIYSFCDKRFRKKCAQLYKCSWRGQIVP
ncbi:hypothetical protein KUTeg_023272 [Tegillarca granosa]|uniref:G-protein coupled receptors family 1 profile domain-containing protein n=1 Tax=Tegillarca granosa TaxID=220873 RepID=A0ABQ9E1R9_TEGGR|nr:hypothetical protein KUTeg_023272 [Tegillarca granosa]